MTYNQPLPPDHFPTYDGNFQQIGGNVVDEYEENGIIIKVCSPGWAFGYTPQPSTKCKRDGMKGFRNAP